MIIEAKIESSTNSLHSLVPFIHNRLTNKHGISNLSPLSSALCMWQKVKALIEKTKNSAPKALIPTVLISF